MLPDDGYLTQEWVGYNGRPKQQHLWRKLSESVSTDIDQIGFLYALVRMLKPELVMESGCHIGLATYALGVAVRDNGLGRVVTCDINDSFCAITKQRVADLPVTIHSRQALDLKELEQCDLLYSDSSNVSRQLEIKRVKKDCIVVVDDTFDPQLAGIQSLGGVTFQTPRGVTVFRKC